MADNDAIFLDANIFMYAAGAPHAYKVPCLNILAAVETGTLTAVTNAEVLQEILYRYTHLNVPEKGIALCQKILAYPLPILPVTETDIRTAINLLTESAPEQIKTRDAVHAATMKSNGITQILTADKHFDSIDFVARLDPLITDW